MKHSNIHGAYACFECHAWLDGGYVINSTRQDRDLAHYEAMIKTQIIMINEGILQL